ncbi:MAG: dipeptidase [Planctomycetales bacterium]|nr:dipeptidase [Planctomycetales bacterium]
MGHLVQIIESGGVTQAIARETDGSLTAVYDPRTPGKALVVDDAPQAKVERAPIVVSESARRLHAGALLIDGHNDMPWEIRKQADSQFGRLDIATRQPTLQTDIPKLRDGGVKAQFWSVWVPVDTMRRGTALTTTLEQIDLVKRMVAAYPETFATALTADDVERIAGEGKIASLIGVEGGHSIENSLAVLNRLYDLGARYMTLTHSDTIEWADSATDEAKHGGLTPFGEDVVREMNRLGMLIDLSHVSPDVMKHALRITKAPVIFSHSSARGVADHPRNVPDDVLPLVAQNGGVVMINFFSGFLVPEAAARDVERMAFRREIEASGADEGERTTALARWDREHPLPRGDVHTLLDHIDRVVRLAGVDHVGLGSDYDGVNVLPRQLEDASCYPVVTQGLLDRGYSEEQVRKILGLNVLRALRAAEQVADRKTP